MRKILITNRLRDYEEGDVVEVSNNEAHILIDKGYGRLYIDDKEYTPPAPSTNVLPPKPRKVKVIEMEVPEKPGEGKLIPAKPVKRKTAPKVKPKTKPRKKTKVAKPKKTKKVKKTKKKSKPKGKKTRELRAGRSKTYKTKAL